MKRAWEIYRTLTGDKLAKLSMALKQAWSEIEIKRGTKTMAPQQFKHLTREWAEKLLDSARRGERLLGYEKRTGETVPNGVYIEMDNLLTEFAPMNVRGTMITDREKIKAMTDDEAIVFLSKIQFCYATFEVFTFAEACKLWGLGESTLRKANLDGRFQEGEVRQSGSTWLVTKQAMERLYGKKG